MITINIKSEADSVKGHGVLSAHDEQLQLVRSTLSDTFEFYDNTNKTCDITHFQTVNFTYLLRFFIYKRKGSTVAHVHFLPETLDKSLNLPWIARKVFYWYLIRFYRNADYLVTVNPYFIKAIGRYGIDSSRVRYIPNFVSTENFYPIAAAKGELRRDFGLPEDRFTVLCVGQLQERKGVMDFVEAARRMPDAEFVWAGDFSFGVISSGYSIIKEIVASHPPNVHFLGLVDHERMNTLYNLSDVMFLPSYDELFPMTVLESMSCHIPVLLRDLPEYKSVLLDFYLKASDISGFIDQLERLKNNETYRKNASSMSEEGAKFYGSKRISEEWRKFYLEVYNSRR